MDGLNLGGVDILGHTDYLGLFPGRTCIDAVRSIDALDLHRLFAEPARFDLADHDPLILAFAEYAWIVTFLGEPDGPFEKNLIYTAHCSHSAEVVSLTLKPETGIKGHLTEFHVRQFLDQCPLSLQAPPSWQATVQIEWTGADKVLGGQILKASGVDPSQPLVALHPGSGGLAKCWHVDNYLTVAQGLLARDIQVLFLLGPAEQERFEDGTRRRIDRQVKVLTDLSLEEVLAVLSRSDAFVGNDSGISHLAGGLGMKTFVVFGPTDPAIYRPIGPHVTAIRDPADSFAQRPSVDFQRRVLAVLTEQMDDHEQVSV